MWKAPSPGPCGKVRHLHCGAGGLLLRALLPSIPRCTATRGGQRLTLPYVKVLCGSREGWLGRRLSTTPNSTSKATEPPFPLALHQHSHSYTGGIRHGCWMCVWKTQLRSNSPLLLPGTSDAVRCTANKPCKTQHVDLWEHHPLCHWIKCIQHTRISSSTEPCATLGYKHHYSEVTELEAKRDPWIIPPSSALLLLHWMLLY